MVFLYHHFIAFIMLLTHCYYSPFPSLYLSPLCMSNGSAASWFFSSHPAVAAWRQHLPSPYYICAYCLTVLNASLLGKSACRQPRTPCLAFSLSNLCHGQDYSSDMCDNMAGKRITKPLWHLSLYLDTPFCTLLALAHL